MKKAVIYARFSSHSQTEQSIEGQLRECYDFAKRSDITIVGEYIDRALTGTSDKRPQFLKMIDDSKKKNFEFVLVYQLDRFARNRYDSANYKAKLKKNGVRVLSAKENITDDASGILVEGMLESMAEYYSAELSQKVKRGIKESLIKGNFIGGYGLLGYDTVDKKWTVNPLEAVVVKDIFTRYRNGEKAKDIINRLNATGIKTKSGKKFTMSQLSRIIRNEKYTGIVRTDGNLYTNVIPPIVDAKLFKECNLIMDSHKHKQRKNYDEQPYILSGKLFCGYCDSAITAETGTSKTGKVYHYYKCYGKKMKTTDCHKKPVSQDYIETLVFEATIKYILTPKTIERLAKIVADKFNSELAKPTVLLSLEKQLKDINKSIDGIMAAIENGIFTKTTKERLLNLEATQTELENKISVEQSRLVKPLEICEVKKFLTYFAYMKYEKGEEKNEFFNSFINRVILYDDKVIILYNSNDREIKRLTKKQLKEAENAENLEEIKENSSEPCEFKRVALGGESEIRTRATVYHRTNPLAGGPLIASWVFLRENRGYVKCDSFTIIS